MRLIKVVFSVALLSACAPTHFDAAPNSSHAAKPCPPLVRYSCKENADISAAIGALPANSILRKTSDDYHLMREQCGPVPQCEGDK